MPDGPELSDALRRIADANLRYYQGLGRLTVDYVRTLAGLFGNLRGAVAPAFAPPAPPFAARPAPAPPPPPAPAASTPQPALVLEGAAGARAGAVFRVSNDLRRAVSAPVVVSPFRDDAGREHPLALRVEPAVVELAAGGQTLVEVHVTIPADAEVGVVYLAEVTVPGLAAGGVPVVLRRLPDPPAPAEAPVASAAASTTKAAEPVTPVEPAEAAAGAAATPRRARGGRGSRAV